MKKTQPRKILPFMLVFGLIVFLNCCGFPVYNLTKKWSLDITAECIFLLSGGAIYSGVLLAGSLPEKHGAFIVALTMALACAGLGCRFLLEFGEVSNIYNFTIPNIVLHLITFVALSFLSWQYAVKRFQVKSP